MLVLRPIVWTAVPFQSIVVNTLEYSRSDCSIDFYLCGRKFAEMARLAQHLLHVKRSFWLIQDLPAKTKSNVR